MKQNTHRKDTILEIEGLIRRQRKTRRTDHQIAVQIFDVIIAPDVVEIVTEMSLGLAKIVGGASVEEAIEFARAGVGKK